MEHLTDSLRQEVVDGIRPKLQFDLKNVIVVAYSSSKSRTVKRTIGVVILVVVVVVLAAASTTSSLTKSRSRRNAMNIDSAR